MLGICAALFLVFLVSQTVSAQTVPGVEIVEAIPTVYAPYYVDVLIAGFFIVCIAMVFFLMVAIMRTPQYFSKYEALKTGWSLVWKNILFFVLLLIVSYILVFLPEFITRLFSLVGKIPNLSLDMNIFNPTKISLYAGIMLFVKLVCMGFVGTRMIHVALDLLDGKKVSLQKVFTDRISVKGILFFVIACLIYKLLVVLGLFIFVIPGVIISVIFCLWPFYMVDKGYGPIKSLIASLKAVQGINVWDVFLFIVLCSAINVLGLLVLGVGLFITIPLTLIAFTHVYRQLSSKW